MRARETKMGQPFVWQRERNGRLSAGSVLEGMDAEPMEQAGHMYCQIVEIQLQLPQR